MKNERVNQIIQELVSLSEMIETNTIGLLIRSRVSVHYPTVSHTYYYDPLVEEQDIELHREIIQNYQLFYSQSLSLIQEYNPNLEPDFVSLYDNRDYYHHCIKDIIDLKGSFEPGEINALVSEFRIQFVKQIGILKSIPPLIKIAELNLRKEISSTFIESDIDQAEILYDSQFYRAAGAIAGVALEKYIRTLCDINDIGYGYKETMQPLIDRLRSEDIIDKDFKKKLDYLAGIRNKCAHPDEPEKREIKHLIDLVKSMNLNIIH